MTLPRLNRLPPLEGAHRRALRVHVQLGKRNVLELRLPGHLTQEWPHALARRTPRLQYSPFYNFEGYTYDTLQHPQE